MRVHIKLELIGGAGAWVAKISDFSERFNFRREFIKPLTDYSESNSVGTRGVYRHYFLDDGLYEIREPLTWNKTDRYFAIIQAGKIERMSMIEAVQYLTAQSENPADRIISESA